MKLLITARRYIENWMHHWLIIVFKRLQSWMGRHSECAMARLLLDIQDYVVEIVNLPFCEKRAITKCIVLLHIRRYLRFFKRIWYAIKSNMYIIVVVFLLAFIISLLGAYTHKGHSIWEEMWELRDFIMSSAVVVVSLDFIQEERKRRNNLKWQYWLFYTGYNDVERLYGHVFSGTNNMSLYRSKEQRGLYKDSVFSYPRHDFDLQFDYKKSYRLYYQEVRKALVEVVNNKERLVLNTIEVNETIQLAKICLEKMGGEEKKYL